jgi:predicted nucleotidyltransferase
MKEKYKKELNKLKKQIVTQYKPEKIILFGSLASGKIKKNSDIDLLVIKNSKKDYWSRAKEIAKIINIDVPADVLNISTKELSDRLALKDFFILDIINNGKVIYETAKSRKR